MGIGVPAFVFDGSGLVESISPKTAESGASQGTAATQEILPDASASLRQKLGDTVSISQAAYDKQAQAADEAETSLWETKFGLRNGTTMLKNGNRRTVTMEGSSMLIEEYDGDKLVRKETGVISGDKMIRDIERYDDLGRVSQTSHLELTGLGDDGELTSEAVMTRSMKWFEKGELTREMRDKATVGATYRGYMSDPGEAYAVNSLEDLTGKVTQDMVSMEYYASIQEYADGKITKSAMIKNRVDSENITNRTGEDIGDFVSESTQETAKTSGLSVSMQTYDAEGELLRTDDFTDGLVKNGIETQRIASSWYQGGELVKRQSGTFSAEAGDKHLLQGRASIQRTLGLSTEEYSASKPLSASNLLAKPSDETAGDGAAYLRGVSDEIGRDGYDTGLYFNEEKGAAYIHDIRYEEETYKEGELVARSVDRSSANKNVDFEPMEFNVGAGLTETDAPALLSRASHERESYEDGRLKTRAVTQFREFTQEDERGVEELKTTVTGVITGDRENADVSKVVMGGVLDADNLSGSAFFGMSDASNVFTGDLRGMIERAGDDG